MIRALLMLLAAGAALSGDDRDDVIRRMDTQAQHFGDVSRPIWEFAEGGYKENKSADLLKSELRKAGFRIDDGVAQMPTAFVASWGQGKPIIAILGEYDALPGLSQETTPDRKPRVANGAGHGCGHN